jgi:hypothetical protein
MAMADALPYRSRDATSAHGNDEGDNEEEEEDVDETVSELKSRLEIPDQIEGLQDSQGCYTLCYRRQQVDAEGASTK